MTTDFTTMAVVHTIEGAADIEVERDHTYLTEAGSLGFDLYRPPGATGPRPAVVFVSGYPDPGMIAMVGKPLKDSAFYGGWARMVAASGSVAIAYTNREPADVIALVRHLRLRAEALRIDPARIGVWASSGHVPTALGLIAREPVTCAALLYGYFLDMEGFTAVADAAHTFHFAVPPITILDLPRTTPMLVVRAGRDTTPGLDETLRRFTEAARQRGLPVTLLDHAEAPHSFDLVDPSPRTREVIEHVITFLRDALR